MNWLTVVAWIVGTVALAAAVKFLVFPWIPPLYARYKEFVQRKALGK